MGGATRYSICRGQKKEKEADKTFSMTVYMMAILALIYVLVGAFCPGKIASLLGAEGEIWQMTKNYLKVLLLFAPAFMTNDTLLCFVRNDGNPGLSMTAMLTGSFSNILLDYIFIFPMKMGIFGAVFATGLAPVISLGVLSVHWIRQKNQFHFRICTPKLSSAGGILSLGFPSMITELASGIVIIVFNMLILKLKGNIGVAAYGVVANLSLVISSVYTGIAQGMQPVLSRLYGAREKEKIRNILRYGICLTAIISVLVYVAFWIGAEPVTAVFNSEGNLVLQELAVTGMKLYFTAVFFAGCNIVLSAYFTSTEKAVPAQIISLGRGLVLIIPVSVLMASLFVMNGVWLSYPVTEGIIAVIGIYLYKKRGKIL